MTHAFKTTTAAHITRHIAGLLASALITFTLFHEVAMLAEPAAQPAAANQLAVAPTASPTHQ